MDLFDIVRLQIVKKLKLIVRLKSQLNFVWQKKQSLLTQLNLLHTFYCHYVAFILPSSCLDVGSILLFGIVYVIRLRWYVFFFLVVTFIKSKNKKKIVLKRLTSRYNFLHYILNITRSDGYLISSEQGYWISVTESLPKYQSEELKPLIF